MIANMPGINAIITYIFRISIIPKERKNDIKRKGEYFFSEILLNEKIKIPSVKNNKLSFSTPEPQNKTDGIKKTTQNNSFFLSLSKGKMTYIWRSGQPTIKSR